jgi:hypothetical protein
MVLVDGEVRDIKIPLVEAPPPKPAAH